MPRIGSIVDSRAEQIKRDVADSERLVAEYKQIKEKADILVSDARHSAFSRIDDATKKAEAEINSQMNAVEKKIGIDTSKAEERLARSKSKLMEEVPAIAESLKNEILNKLGKNIKVGKEAEINSQMNAVEKKIGVDTSKAEERLPRSKSKLMEKVPAIAASLKKRTLNKSGKNIKVGK